MFVCLQFGGYRRTLRETISGQRVRVRRVPVPGGDGFVTAQISEGRIPDQDLARIVRRCGGSLLCPPGTPLPQTLEACVFKPAAFPLYLSLHTLESVLRLSRIPPRELSIGVYDPNTLLIDAAGCLLPFCRDLRISTDTPAAFDPLAQCAYQTLGACVTARGGEDILRGCDLLLRDSMWYARGTAFRCSCASVPERFMRWKPESIDPDLFAAALLEKSFVRNLQFCTAQKIETGEKKQTIREAAQAMREIFIKNY